MRKLRNLAIFILSFSFVLVVSICLLYKYSLTSVSNKDEKEVLFEIKEGDTSKDIAINLRKKSLIRNDKIFLIYLKLNNINDLKAGYFNLSKSMSTEKIVEILRKNSTINPNNISILFNEGINVRKLAKIIDNETNNSYDDVINKLSDKEYIDSLIDKYWFLTEDIKNTNIYYSLEGYLYPNTYIFDDKDVKVEDIIKKMLDQEEEILNKYKDDIDKSNYSIHEIITLASIAELEGVDYEDKRNIISVFNNRLSRGMSLGSDVTTYYSAKVDMNERDLYSSEINALNAYNTRAIGMEGKLPVGPISNPGEQTIKATLNATKTDYLYFVADKNRKVYFTKSKSEHDKIIAQLKSEGLWYEWSN